MTWSRTDNRGFTLIELLMVMVIMGILVAVAIPAVRTMQSTAMQVAARQVSNSLQLARQYAITKRTPVRFAIPLVPAGGALPTFIGKNYIVMAATNNADGARIGWVPLQGWQILPEGIVFSDQGNVSTVNMPAAIPIGDNVRSLTNQPPNGFMDVASLEQVFRLDDGVWKSNEWTFCYVHFEPTGVTDDWLDSTPARGIRLAQGTVTDAFNLKISIHNTNEWAYIEYDRFGGRIRIRYPLSYN